MLTENAQQFKNYLISKDMDLEFVEQDNGDSVLELRQELKCGAKMRIVLVFTEDDSLVCIYGVDFIQGINPSKKNYMYEAINDINKSYSYYKFIMNKDDIISQAFLPVDGNFKSEVIMNLLFGMIRVVENEFAGLMRIMWS